MPYVALRRPTLPYVALRCPTSPYVALRGPTLPYVALRCPTLPYVALPGLRCPTLPYVALPGPARPYVALRCPTRPTLPYACDGAGGTLAGAKKAKDRSSARGFDNKWERHAKSDAMHICSQTPTNTQTSESMLFRGSSRPKPREFTGVCVLQVPWSMIFRRP